MVVHRDHCRPMFIVRVIGIDSRRPRYSAVFHDCNFTGPYFAVGAPLLIRFVAVVLSSLLFSGACRIKEKTTTTSSAGDRPEGNEPSQTGPSSSSLCPPPSARSFAAPCSWGLVRLAQRKTRRTTSKAAQREDGLCARGTRPRFRDPFNQCCSLRTDLPHKREPRRRTHLHTFPKQSRYYSPKNVISPNSLETSFLE